MSSPPTLRAGGAPPRQPQTVGTSPGRGLATVVLFGKVAGEKRRRSIDPPVEPLLERIDDMPMRQREVTSRTDAPL